MDKRPIRIDILRIEYGRRKLCQCPDPHYIIDAQNKLVECEDCGAIVDPFEAILEIARSLQRINDQHERMLKERESVVGFEPRLHVMKELSKRYTGKNSKMVPRCPHCHVPFELHDLLNTSWCSRPYLLKKNTEEA